MRKPPVRLLATTASHPFLPIPTSGIGYWPPALLTSPSIEPRSDEIRCTAAFTASSSRMSASTPTSNATIRSAITHTRLLQFVLRGHVRIAEPHDYGIRNGVPQLLVYQVAGASSSGKLPNWRWVVLAQATELRVLDR